MKRALMDDRTKERSDDSLASWVLPLHTSVTKPETKNNQVKWWVCKNSLRVAKLNKRSWQKSIKTVCHEHNTAWQDTSWLSRGSKHSQLERGIKLWSQIDRNDAENRQKHEASWSTVTKKWKRICNKERAPFLSKAPCRVEDWPRALFHLTPKIYNKLGLTKECRPLNNKPPEAATRLIHTGLAMESM